MAKVLIAKGSQAAYDGIATKNADTIYVCLDSGNLYVGEEPIFEVDAFVSATLSGRIVTFTKKDGTTFDLNLSSAFTAAIIFRGSVPTYSDLPEDAAVGDLYDVIAAVAATEDHPEYPAGTNFAWTGIEWDPMGSSIDLSPLLTKDEAASTYATIAALANKVDKTTTVNGKALSGNITLDGADVKVTGYTKAATAEAIAPTDTINQALGKLEKSIEKVAEDSTTDVTEGDGISVDSSNPNSPTVSVKLNEDENNMASVDANGLMVTPMQWNEMS